MLGFWGKKQAATPAAPADDETTTSDGPVLGWDDQYRALHGGVHRKGASRVGTPAIARHFAIWMPQVAPGEDFQQRRDRWVADLDYFLASLILNVYQKSTKAEPPISINARIVPKRNQSEPTKYEFVLLRHAVEYEVGKPQQVIWRPIYKKDGTPTDRAWDARFETVGLTFFHEGVPIKLRAELHTEYFAMTAVAALDCESKAESDERCNRPTPAVIRDRFKDIKQVCARRWFDAQANGATTQTRDDAKGQMESDVAALTSAADYFYKQFWADFEQEIVAPALKPVLRKPDLATGGPGPLSTHLGKLFADFRGLVLSTKIEKAPSPEPQHRLDAVFDDPFSVPERSSLADYVKPDRMEEKNQIHLLDAILPLIDCARRVHATEDSLPAVEYAAASMHGRRAVYISALGPQSLFNQEHREPVCYAIATKHRHRWQISRLIDRLHTLGTLRTASLWDFDQLNKGGSDLRDATRLLDRIEAPGTDTESWKKANDKYRDALRDRGHGGLQYRANRARFYINQFLQECEELRFDRVEGFQPYKAFVLRRVGRTWDFIRNLVDRTITIGRRLETLNGEIRAQQELEQTTKLTRLLEFAEWSAAVPVAYYGGHLLEATLEGDVAHAIAHFLHQPLRPILPLGDLMLVMLGIYVLVILFINRRRESEKRNSKKKTKSSG